MAPSSHAARSVRGIHRVRELSDVQIHQARDDRRGLCSSRLQRRDRRQEIKAWQKFLRLLGISEVRRRLLGQAYRRTVPQCNAPFLLEKTTKKGTSRICAREDCGYREEVHVPDAGIQQSPASGERRSRARAWPERFES